MGARREPRPLSPRNARVSNLRRLVRRRSSRRDERAFVIEGPVLIAEALDAQVPVTDVFLGDDLVTDSEPDLRRAPDPSAAVLARVLATDVPVWQVPAASLARAVDVVTPRPIAAVAAIPPTDDRQLMSTADLVLVLDQVSDPGNAGTLLRVAEASGVGAVIFGGASVDPYGPKCVRASAGALFRVPVVVEGSTMRAIERLADSGHEVVATRAGSALSYDAVDYTRSVAFVLGNEARGLSAGVADRATATVAIPMAGRTESLNVAMAGTVLCFEAARQRRGAAARNDRPAGDGGPDRSEGRR